jgi:hypothetical protein
MRRILRLSIIFTSFISSWVLFALVVGTLQADNLALAGFDVGCENTSPPCWNGIVPGRSNGYQARVVLMRLGYDRVFITNYNVIRRCAEDGQLPTCVDVGFRDPCNDLSSGCDLELVSGLALHYEGHILLGDVLASMGTPVYVDYVRNGVQLMYREYYRIRAIAKHPSLYHPVVLEIYAGSYEDSIFGDQPWRGLMPSWRYCQLEPQAFAC